MKKRSVSKAVKWVARILSLLVIAYCLIMTVGYAIQDFPSVEPVGCLLGVLLFFMIGSMLLAWLNPMKGGLLNVLFGSVMGIFIYMTAGSNVLIAMMLIPSPFILIGLLFVLHWRLDGGKWNVPD